MKTIIRMLLPIQIVPIFLSLALFGCAKEGGSPDLDDDPVKYVGKIQPDKAFYDGKLPHAIGVQHFQAFRANRRYPSEGGKVGWTYNHQPFLAYWKGKFYIQYLSDLLQEHTPPGRTLLLTSENGRDWSKPSVVFPPYDLPQIKHDEHVVKAGTKAVMHQRMGFYVAPNGKLLTLAFYSYCPTPRHSPNAGNGLGRVVREIKEDGSYGPIYFIRYNRHAGFNEENTNYPFYKTSKDEAFLAACESLLADKLITLQWWEEDRADDGFYVINPGDAENAAYFSANITTSKGAGKAFNFYHRADGAVVGIWKNQWSALSYDEGKSWDKLTQNKSLMTTGAKTWGQKTSDNRYAIVHNQSPTRRNRYPMAVLTGADGHIFDAMYCLRGEVPPKRYQGLHKNTGPQYFRGIIEGNGMVPDGDMWISYSVNKEDIWISRTNVPISATTDSHINQGFDKVDSEMDLELWNLYQPIWAPTTIVAEKGKNNKCLQLKDEDPYDYACVERVFPKSSSLEIAFRFNAREIAQGHALEIEVQNQQGTRPMRVRIDQNWISIDRKKVYMNPLPIEMKKWYKVNILMDCTAQKYALVLDGVKNIKNIPFAEKVDSLERIVFRTGPYRGFVPPEHVDDAMPKPAGLESEDRPGSDTKAPACIYWIDDVSTKTR